MALEKYEDHTVVIQTVNDKIFRGKVIDFLRADYGETDIDSIVVRDVIRNKLIEFTEADIKTIDIVK